MSDLELGPERRDAASPEHRGMILRYTAGERTNHWMVAMAFVLAALSGLALFHPALFGLSGLFGGGPWTRILHPFIGLAMLLAFLPFALRVGSENRMQPRDWAWLRQYRDVVMNREDRLPEVGRYNAGQKLVFYAIVLCLTGLLLSGVAIWRAYFSIYFPAVVVRWGAVLHALCALVLICTIKMCIRDRFVVSLMKAWWGDGATAENNWAYDYLPKLDKLYDMLQVFELMSQGKMNGFICQGFNPLAAAPNKAKMNLSLAKLKYLVVMDPLATETSEFWRNFGEHNDVDSARIQTEVFRLPTSCFAEEEGSLTNSSRWLQWHWKGAEPPGEARSDLRIMAEIFTRMRALYQNEGGTFADPILKLSWPYARPTDPTPQELAREFSGKALKDLADPKDPTKVTRKAGEQLAGFAELRNDGSTSSGCWIFCGAWGPTGNLMARRDKDVYKRQR